MFIFPSNVSTWSFNESILDNKKKEIHGVPNISYTQWDKGKMVYSMLYYSESLNRGACYFTIFGGASGAEDFQLRKSQICQKIGESCAWCIHFEITGGLGL